MTPSEILLKFKETGSADFLSELEGEDLWGFLEKPLSYYIYWAFDVDTFEALEKLQIEVVVELRREVAADLDVWMNLARSDLKVKQEWIDNMEEWVMIQPYSRKICAEILAYLKERQVK